MYEQAKRLKELGVVQDGLVDWTDTSMGPMLLYRTGLPSSEIVYSAFTVAELGELLIINDDTHFTIGNYNEHLGCWDQYLHMRTADEDGGFVLIPEASLEADTEAEARADMLIYLLENKIITAPNVQECDATDPQL